MASDNDSSDLSSLSSLSPVPSDDELDAGNGAPKNDGILKFFSKVSEQSPRSPSPPPRKRSPSPTHEYVLADNPDIAFIVMFRSRFIDALPKSLANFGPQELERDVVEPIPGDRAEHFLCALLGLLLNRKQDVKPGHYNRALEDAIASHKGQWPASWEDKSPLTGGGGFNTMNPTQRLTLLRTLILWTMSSSESVKAIINQAYKQNRHEDDLNQPRAVQPWGSDGDKRRYFLVEGQDDTAFRVYRESNPAGTNRTWWSVAGSIEELRALAEKLNTKDGGPKAKKLSNKMIQAIPRFEAGEEKRKRREYRLMRKEQFKRPEPGFSMYEGRTRGKRVKYTYSDDEDMFYSDSTNRRSARNTGANTPAEPPTTASGRTVRVPSRMGAGDDSAAASIQGDYSEADREGSVGVTGRPRRAAATGSANGWGEANGRGHSNRPSLDSDDAASEAEFGDDEEDAEAHVPEESEEEDDEFDEDEAMVDDDIDDSPKSLVVKLAIKTPNLRTALSPIESVPNALPTPNVEDQKPALGETPSKAVVDVIMEDSPAQEAGREEQSALLTETKHEDQSADKPDAQTEQAGPDIVAASSTAVSSAPLAFRGSPEKKHVQPAAVPGIINAPQ
ncbi:hypothetical protein ISF_01349 [Cordyceps fumosorosea ARSEF 2679]|uniref:WHIM1 domain-containing protein n=1 Tax=Cordyceps fumosorosea (strain ARSEF 2679) TaxID=1081104 RepID=A0A168D839_CORFA|nr:hypothetical protein ISF_01349 [Cordyceps fumosorosea ARSEF 2679]OAA72276.1 hypothetical protein ISF_01349 [Cordyceps fumosorosea ARSEF 2679]